MKLLLTASSKSRFDKTRLPIPTQSSANRAAMDASLLLFGFRFLHFDFVELLFILAHGHLRNICCSEHHQCRQQKGQKQSVSHSEPLVREAWSVGSATIGPAVELRSDSSSFRVSGCMSPVYVQLAGAERPPRKAALQGKSKMPAGRHGATSGGVARAALQAG